MKKNACLMIGTILLSGCSNTIWVHEKETGSKDKAVSAAGIPFYVKVEKYEQNTKYSQTWIEATMRVRKLEDTDEKKGIEIVKTFSEEYVLSDEIKNFNMGVLACDSSWQAVKSLVTRFYRLKEIKYSDVKPVLISNTIKSVWVVDGSKTYYLNAPLPWFGKNTFSSTLNSDGTLITASSAPDTQLAQGISSLFPVKEVFSNIVTSALTKNIEIADEKKYQVSLNFEKKGYTYTYSKQFNAKPDSLKPIHPSDNNAYFVREPLFSQAAESPKKSDKKSIGFNGEITLPK